MTSFTFAANLATPSAGQMLDEFQKSITSLINKAQEFITKITNELGKVDRVLSKACHEIGMGSAETISFSPHTMLKTITATLALASAIASPIDTSSIKPITNFLDGLVEATPCKLPILKTIFTKN